MDLQMERVKYENTRVVGNNHIATGETKEAISVTLHELFYKGKDYKNDIELKNKIVSRLDAEKLTLLEIKANRLAEKNKFVANKKTEVTANEKQEVALDIMKKDIPEKLDLKIKEFKYEPTKIVGKEHISTGETKVGMSVTLNELFYEGEDYKNDIEFIDKIINKIDEQKKIVIKTKACDLTGRNEFYKEDTFER